MKTKLLAILMLIVLAITACGAPAPAPLLADTVVQGQVYLAQPGTTLYWINQAFQGATNTWLLTKDGTFLIMWNMPGGQGMGFTMVKEAGTSVVAPIIDWMSATKGKGNIASYQDVTSFIDYMKKDGWKPASTAAVSQSLKSAFAYAWEATRTAGQAALDGFLASGQSMISIIVMPVGAVPTCDPAIPLELCEFQNYE